MTRDDLRKREDLLAEVRAARSEIAALRRANERLRWGFEASNDAILFIDPQRDRILDANPRACAMLGYAREELLALTISAVHPTEMPRLRAFAADVALRGIGWTSELGCTTKGGLVLPAEISAAVAELDGRPCIVAIVRDVSERKRAEQDLHALVDSLREALARVRTLSGLLPICAGCKKIRDEAGGWHRVEQYIRDRSDAEFTHGLCPECLDRLYPPTETAER